ncbi:MAG TPA: ABC transporter permease, partial [Acidimicrobiia bacterium]|nr:ABC transporter permease [Acidimicrobiia bacterium]
MGDALRIAVKDLRLRVRDRSAFILGILAPVVLAYVFYLVFGTAASGEGLGLRYGLVDADRSDISMAFAEVLEGAQAEGVLELIVFNDTEEATAALDDGDIDAYFSIPEGLEEAIFANQSVTIDIVGDVDEPTSTQIAAAFARQFASGVAASQLAVATTATLQGIEVSPDVIAGLSSDPATAGMSFRLVDETATTKQLDTSTFFAAGMAVFFLFFTVQYGVTGLLEEEREGTLARLMAAPIPRSAVVAGKAIMAFVLGVVSMTVLIAATSLLMGATWGSVLGVALLVVSGVLAAIGIMGLVASIAKTPEGAESLAAIVAVVLGMLGGTFFPI